VRPGTTHTSWRSHGEPAMRRSTISLARQEMIPVPMPADVNAVSRAAKPSRSDPACMAWRWQSIGSQPIHRR
jgi:hypothetical protein